MKHEQVTVDYWTMFKTSLLFVFLAFSGYILIKMVQTIFWLPSHLQRNQKRLEQLAAQYSIEMNRGIENGTADDKESAELLKGDEEGAVGFDSSCKSKEALLEKAQPVENEPKKVK